MRLAFFPKRTTEYRKGQRLATIDLFGGGYGRSIRILRSINSLKLRTVRVRQSPGSADRTGGIRVGAIRELVPVFRVRRQVLGFDLDGVIDVNSREGFAGVYRLSTELGIVPDFEVDAEWDTLLVRYGSRGNCACPEKDGIIEGIALMLSQSMTAVIRQPKLTLATVGNVMVRRCAR